MPATTIALASTPMVCWPTCIYVGVGAGVGIVMIDVPMTRTPEGPRLIGVPEIVWPGASGFRVVPSIVMVGPERPARAVRT